MRVILQNIAEQERILKRDVEKKKILKPKAPLPREPKKSRGFTRKIGPLHGGLVREMIRCGRTNYKLKKLTRNRLKQMSLNQSHRLSVKRATRGPSSTSNALIAT